MLATVDMTAHIVVPEDRWLIGNIDYMGFYRTNYDISMWKRIIEQLHTDHTVATPNSLPCAVHAIVALIPPSHSHRLYLYSGCLAWYSVLITSRIHSKREIAVPEGVTNKIHRGGLVRR